MVPNKTTAVAAADNFGTALFSLVTSKSESGCLGCCKSEYDTTANFYPHLMTTVTKEKYTACCCRELPETSTLAAYPKYKVMSVAFADYIAAPFCCSPSCPAPCCNTAVCGCCFKHKTEATLGIKAGGDGTCENTTFVCQGDEETQRKALAWVYGGLAEGAEGYHCASHLRDADLIAPSKFDIMPRRN